MESKSLLPLSVDWIEGTPLKHFAHDQLNDDLMNGERDSLLYFYSLPNADDVNEKKVPPEDDKESCVDENEGPDGGWGWVVVFSCFVIWVSTQDYLFISVKLSFGSYFSSVSFYTDCHLLVQ